MPSAGRHCQFIRCWNLVVLLRRRWYALAELAAHFNVSQRTVRRDLVALQALDIPVVCDKEQGQLIETEDSSPRWRIVGFADVWPLSDPLPRQMLDDPKRRCAS